MKQIIKNLLLRTPFFHRLRYGIHQLKEKMELKKWENSGKPVPPPHIVKQRVLSSHARQYNLKILVETGTYYGDMVEAMKNKIDRIYSIELSKELHSIAKKRFKSESHISLIQGDSGEELKNLLPQIIQPALFWLDGHYSAGNTARGAKDTPIYEELESILKSSVSGHVILIDDARCFGTDPAYPDFEELSSFIHSLNPNVRINVDDDSIRIVPIN